MKTNLKKLWDAAHEYSGKDPATGFYPCTPMTQALYDFEAELREELKAFKNSYQSEWGDAKIHLIKEILGEE